MKKLISALTALIILATTSMAEDIKEKFNPVQTAVVSQSIAPDARAGGMGDVGAATEADINSQAWNAAKYPFAISKGGIALNYTPWLRQLVNDIDLAYMAGYYRLGDYQAVSASLRYFSLGDVMVNGMDNTTIKPYELAVDAAYSRMLSEKFSAAVTFRYIYSDLSGKSDDGSKPGSAFAADLSAYYNTFLNMGSSASVAVSITSAARSTTAMTIPISSLQRCASVSTTPFPSTSITASPLLPTPTSCSCPLIPPTPSAPRSWASTLPTAWTILPSIRNIARNTTTMYRPSPASSRVSAMRPTDSLRS